MTTEDINITLEKEERNQYNSNFNANITCYTNIVALIFNSSIKNDFYTFFVNRVVTQDDIKNLNAKHKKAFVK